MTDASRRDLLKGTAVAGAGLAAAPALGQAARRSTPNPATAYPKGPFPEQRQKWPAL